MDRWKVATSLGPQAKVFKLKRPVLQRPSLPNSPVWPGQGKPLQYNILFFIEL